jgi:hypothetical protein
MSALDQFSKFCAKIAGGLAPVRPSPQCDRNEDSRGDAAAATRGQPAAQPTGRDHDRPHPSRVSHPAAWPR